MRLALAFASAHWMVDRVLDHTADVRTNPEPASASRLAGNHILVVFIADLADCRHALEKHEAKFAAGHANEGVFALFRHELSGRSGRADKDRAASRFELHVVDDRTDGDVLKLKRISGTDVRAFARNNLVAYVESDRSDDVSLLAVFVGDECDAGSAVGIVFDRRYSAGTPNLSRLKSTMRYLILPRPPR